MKGLGRRASASVALLLFALACKGGEKGGSTGPTPAIGLTLSKSSLSIQQGGSDNLVASVTRSGGFAGDVAITVEGVPASVTGAVSNIATSGGVTTGTVTVNVAASVAAGSYNVVVRASGSGVTSVTVSATLVVTAIPAIGISLAPTALGVNQAASGQTTITIARTNFTGNVAFVLEGAPAGVTGTFVPAPAPGATATLTVQVGATVTIASYNLTVRATGTGVTDATAPLVLTVNPAPAISIALSPAAVSVDQGASGQSTVTITRTNFTANVTLALEGAPTGVTGTFVPSPAPGTTSTLTIQVGAAVAAATYNLTVRATGDAIPAATAPLDLTVTVPASYTMSATSPSITVGGAGPSTIAITRTNFTGPIALTLEGAPAGVTGSFNPLSVTGTSSILTITVALTVATGAYPMTVRGTATGLVDRTAALTLTVAPVAGSYTLSISPAGSVGVSQGGGVAVPVAINRTGGFIGDVTLSVTGAPNGLTATLAPTATTGNVSALSILAAQSLSADPYPLTVTGTTPGLADRTTNITAIVTAPNVSLDFSNCGTLPNWFAIQDGVNGPWVQTLAPGGTYKTRTTQSAVALTLVTPGFGTNHSIWTQYMSATELQNTNGAAVCGNPIIPSRTAVVSTVNLATFDIAWVSFGGALRTFSSTLPGGTLSGILPGAHDLIAHSSSQTPGVFQPSDRLIFRRDLNPSSGASILPALDFGPASTETFAPIAATISLGSPLLPGEILNSAGTLYKTGASCDNIPLWFTSPNAAVTSFTAYGVPLAKQRPTDFHAITITTEIQGVQFRFVTEYMQALTNRTITLPSSLPVPTITTQPAGYQRLQFEFTAPSDLSNIITASYGFNSGNPVFLSATAGWFGSTAINLSVPAFANSANWDDSWGPPANPVATDWNLTGQSSPLVGPCTVGGRLTSASRTGHF